jgi:S1-C subfamily serine protease
LRCTSALKREILSSNFAAIDLPETFEALRQSIIAFISRVKVTPPGSPTPLFPAIIGTGFFVNASGITATNRHVIDVLEQVSLLPRIPSTGASAVGALVFTAVRSSGEKQGIGILNVDVLSWKALEQFEAKSPWYGESVPDLGFVQLKVCEVPAVALAAQPNVLRAGVSVATAGFPEGSSTITFHNRITQLTPVLRHGIISSVFPFAGPNPHGFSIDALLQGGASGSPVFKGDEPTVVGMIASQIENTNYTVCVPAYLLARALTSALIDWPKFEGVPTLENLIAAGELTGEQTLRWEPIVPPNQ